MQKETRAGCSASIPCSSSCQPQPMRPLLPPWVPQGDWGGLFAEWWPQGSVGLVWPLPAVLQGRDGDWAAAKHSGARGVVAQEGASREDGYS